MPRIEGSEKPRSSAPKQIGVRLTPEIMAQVEEYRERLSDVLRIEVPRSMALQSLVSIGLEESIKEREARGEII